MSEACLMLPITLDEDTRAMLIELQHQIPVNLLTGDGLEDFHHVTVLYGIKDPLNSLVPLAKIINLMHPFPIKLGKITFFRENEDFDVMKISIESKALHTFNSLLRDVLPYENSYPTYVPHLTIAYVKKGALKELENSSLFENKVFVPKSAVYSFPDRTTACIPFYDNSHNQLN